MVLKVISRVLEIMLSSLLNIVECINLVTKYLGDYLYSFIILGTILRDLVILKS